MRRISTTISVNTITPHKYGVKHGSAYTTKSEISAIDEKLGKLLDAHLDGVISKEEYTSKKRKLLNRKIEISEKLSDFEKKGNYWLEPMKLFILDIKQAEIIASKENLSEKRDFLKKIGSNPLLQDRTLSVLWQNPWKILVDFPIPSAYGGEKFEGSTIGLRLIGEVRTL